MDVGQSGLSEPEYRLPPAIAGGILVPIGLFWYAPSTVVAEFTNGKLTSVQVCLDHVCIDTLDM